MKDPRFYIDNRKHEAAQQLGLWEIIKSFGFASPFDVSSVIIGQHEIREITKAVGAYKELTTCRTKIVPENALKSAMGILSQTWGYVPGPIEKNSNAYVLRQKGDMKYWPKPTCEQLLIYKEFYESLISSE